MTTHEQSSDKSKKWSRSPQYSYEQFLVGSDKWRYAPWNSDSAFQSIHEMISSGGKRGRFTRVDEWRCFGLWKLVEQSAKLSGGAIIEIGVWKGGSGVLIAKQARLCGIADTVYLCDTFTGLPKIKIGEHDACLAEGKFAVSRQIVEQLLSECGEVDNVRVLEGVFPDETADQIVDQSFRLCHLDVDLYQSAQDILAWVWNKMVIGGIIVYDDYGFRGCPGITKHVNDQMLLDDRLVFYNLDGHGIVIKLK